MPGLEVPLTTVLVALLIVAQVALATPDQVVLSTAAREGMLMTVQVAHGIRAPAGPHMPDLGVLLTPVREVPVMTALEDLAIPDPAAQVNNVQ